MLQSVFNPWPWLIWIIAFQLLLRYPSVVHLDWLFSFWDVHWNTLGSSMLLSSVQIWSAVIQDKLSSMCFLPHRVYWPMFVLMFYILSPIPNLIARRHADDTESSNACRELAYFLTAGIVVSAYGLPVVLARKSVVSTEYAVGLYVLLRFYLYVKKWIVHVIFYSPSSFSVWVSFFCWTQNTFIFKDVGNQAFDGSHWLT